ncbi:MAG: transcriptional regulator [Chloroflexi bacterium HGW-Chloroflexi-4]|nr:MAG: transcriptional regulator [Chloroflexi bacterium HGW-Chloroflexi-4]
MSPNMRKIALRADRLLSIILLLQTRGKMTAKALAEELEVSRRTILRDINAISFSGVPVYSEGGHGGGFSLDEEYRTTLTGLNTLEVQSLFVSSNNEALRDVGLGDAGERLLLKLLAALPHPQHSTVDHIRQRLMIDPTWWWHGASLSPFWDEIQQAVYEDKMIKAKYENFDGEIRERILAPYSLVCKSSVWYLLAERDGELRTYRVDRFHSVDLLDESFVRRPNFDLSTYWREHTQRNEKFSSGYQCTLRIHPDRLLFIKTLMPGRWELVADAEDKEWKTISLSMDSELQAKMLIFGLVGDVEVVEPGELKEAVAAQAREVLKQLA